MIMAERKARTNKVMVLGVDGLDPRYSRYMVDQGKMPYMAEYIKRGACREDLVLLGGHPTITPPMWTTLATGCYANVHGITGFYRQHPDDLAGITYALDSRDCHAEQLWNCTAEAGLKTLVIVLSMFAEALRASQCPAVSRTLVVQHSMVAQVLYK